MSKPIKTVKEREYCTIVLTDDGETYYVDSADTYDAEYETMVFPWNNRRDEVDDWNELYVEHYKTEKDMEKGHERICSNLEKYLV